MKKNFSPWLHQLKGDRGYQKINQDVITDVSIVGAGIAGISTAFFVLKNTDKRVVLLERFKVAHGATGHNAGQIVSYFERGFASLVDEFGLDMAAKGQRDVEDAWHLLDEMYDDAKLTIPFSRFLGHAGLSGLDQVILHLKNNLMRKEGGLNTERILVTENVEFLDKIPDIYKDLYQTVPQEEILNILETKSKDFVAAVSYQKGCVNSALFCEEILIYLQTKYPDRFSLFEHSPIHKIVLKKDRAILDAGNHTVESGRVILCTNGFDSVTIFDESGLDIDTKFHHMIHGTVGYMSGYLEPMSKPPTAISYLTDPDPSTNDPYFYLTRRMYEYDKDTKTNLISIGGPESFIEDSKLYSKDDEYPEEMADMIDRFVRDVYENDPKKNINYIFTWHGLMGYTKNGVRLVGPEPKNEVLMYNLGCNGIGILPSISGAQRISDYISLKKVERSIFDIPTGN